MKSYYLTLYFPGREPHVEYVEARNKEDATRRDAMAETRAAVLELIEAAREFERGTRPGSNPKWAEELRPALLAALARVRGDA